VELAGLDDPRVVATEEREVVAAQRKLTVTGLARREPHAPESLSARAPVADR